jgi:alkylation response protein AidB-like acyl-CoA dehydrogenase
MTSDLKAESDFLAEVRDFVAANQTDAVRRKVLAEKALSRAEADAWQRALHGRGWAAPAWPREYGGTGWPLLQQYLFKREMGRCLAPTGPMFGLQMVGPVIYTFGTAEQKHRYLEAVLINDIWWCQGFSEPGAGSDLASLQTKAALDGDEFVVNGQKIWTSYAHMADMIFMLVRTETLPKKQDGISFLLVDMKTPGITVRPIVSINGSHSLNEVFFDNVRVPRGNLIGEAGRGWTYAKFLLSHERLGIANLPRLWQRFEQLKDLASKPNLDGELFITDSRFCGRLAEIESDLSALEHLELDIVRAAAASAANPADMSILKIVGTELLQRADGLLWELAGRAGAVLVDQDGSGSMIGEAWDSLTSRMLHGRAATIYGGTNEIQRDLVARAALGF